MKDLFHWTIESIRNDKTKPSWLEERKFEWVQLSKNCLERVLEGYSVIVMTDSERDWFGNYIVDSINRPSKNRPFVPIYSIKSIYPFYASLKNDEDMELLNDMLTISFKGNYLFWYIGSASTRYAKLGLDKDDSFLWVMDDEFQNSFYLSSNDEIVDFKLMQLFRIFDKTLSAVLFNEISLEDE